MKQGGSHSLTAIRWDSALHTAGFTIVEVLIVLAVMSLMFVSAVATISGRQAKTEFTTSTNNFKQQLQQFINQAASGFTASTKITCSKGTPPSLSTAAMQTSQGTQGDCIFLGSVIQMGIGSVPNTSGYHVFPVVGNRLNPANSSPVQDLGQAYPVALSPDQGGQDGQLVGGLWLNDRLMQYVDAGGLLQDTHAVGFLSTLGNVGQDSTGNLQGGSTQNFGLYAVAASGTDRDTTALKNSLDATQANPTGGLVATRQVTICLNSGSGDQSVKYTIGNNNDPLSVAMTVFYHVGCV